MSNEIPLETERLLLTAVTPARIRELFEHRTQDEIMAALALDAAGFEKYARMHAHGMETYRISQYYFLMVEKKTGNVVGRCGFHTWDKAHDRAELFYEVRESDRGKGLTGEALPEVLTFGFHVLNLHRIDAKVAAWNTPSVRLLSRHGFTFEGTLREDYLVDGKYENSDCYSLLAHEFSRG